MERADRRSTRPLRSELHARARCRGGKRFRQRTLVKGRQRRIDFNSYCIELAAELGSGCVSLWSGSKPIGCDDGLALDLLAQGLDKLLEIARGHRVCLAFEPEPEMFIDTMAKFSRLREWLGRDELKLTLDIGHLYCQGEVPIADQIVRWGELIRNVHIEDMKAGVHQHLMFGDGDIHFLPVIRALQQIGYIGGLHVELSRHSHEGPAAAKRAFDFLQPLIQQAGLE